LWEANWLTFKWQEGLFKQSLREIAFESFAQYEFGLFIKRN